MKWGDSIKIVSKVKIKVLSPSRIFAYQKINCSLIAKAPVLIITKKVMMKIGKSSSSSEPEKTKFEGKGKEVEPSWAVTWCRQFVSLPRPPLCLCSSFFQLLKISPLDTSTDADVLSSKYGKKILEKLGIEYLWRIWSTCKSSNYGNL